jgi:NTE family protein
VYPSVEIDGLTLVDGGIVANTPIVQAEGLEPTRVYVLSALPDRVPGSRTKAILMVQRAMALALQPADRRALAEAATRCPVWVLPVPGAAGQVSAFDFSATERLMDDAYDTTASWLEARAFIEAAA